ncbi:MAG: alpha/beta hydrolase [Lewinellaceae bacterium]|nr:alpha/beta hydrolase [Phaeodactylibacter sp.]MCB9346672.1 alpha/beta hydrolase [Lewinellaceae bacterium]
MLSTKASIFILSIICSSYIFVSCNDTSGGAPGAATAREGYFTSEDNIRLYYKMTGQGADTLVVIHGGPGMDSEYMVADFEPLADKYKLLFYDQRGGGRSTLPKDTSQLHMTQHITDLEALRTHFGFEKMTLVAHSFGPALAARYAITHPGRVARMVFLGPIPPIRENFWERFGDAVNRRLTPQEQKELSVQYNAMIEGPDTKEACRKFWNIALKPRLAAGRKVSIIKGDCCAASPEAIRYGMDITNSVTINSMGNWDYHGDLPLVTAPTLILHGEEEAIPMDMVEEWVKAMPHAQLIKVPRAAHFTYVERPDVTWPAIEAFLEKK